MVDEEYQVKFIIEYIKGSNLNIKDSNLSIKDSNLNIKDSNLNIKDSNLSVNDQSLDNIKYNHRKIQPYGKRPQYAIVAAKKENKIETKEKADWIEIEKQKMKREPKF